MRDRFDRLAQTITQAAGSPWAFGLAALSIMAWVVVGFFVGFSDTHQLVINTGTTIITFLMVFLIQNTQNRDAKALHLKLDDLIEANQHTHEDVIDAEHQNEEEIERKKRRAKEVNA